jgi:dephospho-CoA kinase
MVRIAITGGIACGKSLVGSLMERRGVTVCEADELGHKQIEPGNVAYDMVVAEFGSDILKADGSIDRRLLGEKVFSDKTALVALNAILHPRIKVALDDWLSSVEELTPAAAIVPLLYETDMSEGWDAVVCVVSAVKQQIERLLARGLNDRTAVQRIESQMSQKKKVEMSDFVILNNSSIDILEKQTSRVLDIILE